MTEPHNEQERSVVISMNPKVKKLREEKAKNCSKIEKLTARNKVIDETVRSLENSDIIGLVREQGLTPDELAKLLTYS